MCISPPRKVPVVITTVLVGIISPLSNFTPVILPCRPFSCWPSLPRIISATLPSTIARFLYPTISSRIYFLYSARSICARGPQTAGPFLRFKTRNCTPALSTIRPTTPSSASTSRSIVPLPIPPKLGLQEHTPRLSSLGVMRAVRAPERAAAALASHPA